MKQGYEFVLQTTYDKPAYQALSAASWVLFRRRHMQVAAYPALFSLAALIGILLIFNWGNYGPGILIGGLAFMGLQFLVIPLGAASARAKMTRRAVKADRKQGHYPAQIQLVFSAEQIHATRDGQTTASPYSAIDCLVSLGDWRLLFFGHAAYILHTSCFQDSGELERFEKFISEKCELPFNRMKGRGPKR